MSSTLRALCDIVPSVVVDVDLGANDVVSVALNDKGVGDCNVPSATVLCGSMGVVLFASVVGNVVVVGTVVVGFVVVVVVAVFDVDVDVDVVAAAAATAAAALKRRELERERNKG